MLDVHSGGVRICPPERVRERKEIPLLGGRVRPWERNRAPPFVCLDGILNVHSGESDRLHRVLSACELGRWRRNRYGSDNVDGGRSELELDRGCNGLAHIGGCRNGDWVLLNR